MMKSIMSKCTFQSPEDFLKDYYAYEHGKVLKILTKDGVKYLSKYSDRNYFVNTKKYLGEVDLVHKFKNVCKLPA